MKKYALKSNISQLYWDNKEGTWTDSRYNPDIWQTMEEINHQQKVWQDTYNFNYLEDITLIEQTETDIKGIEEYKRVIKPTLPKYTHLTNKELSNEIVKSFDWWDLDKSKEEHRQDILTSLNNNEKQDILVMLDYFDIAENNDNETIQNIIYNLKGRL